MVDLIAKTDEIWNKALVLLKEKLPLSTYDAWVINLVPNGIDGNEYSVRCGQRIAIQMMAPHDKIFSSVLSEITGKEISFKVVYDEELSKILAKKSQARKQDEEKDPWRDPGGAAEAGPAALLTHGRAALLRDLPPRGAAGGGQHPLPGRAYPLRRVPRRGYC